ncbi:MAG: DedA family protein [Bryobacter sp.]|jgi:membrane protein DedA with SNARE-associated domain|nr:DedA family protein [Bryobacter sp.]
MNGLEQSLAQYGPAALFLALMLGIVGLPIPDETLLTLSGVLIVRGDFRPIPTFAAALAGALCGITISYVLGRTLGIGAVHRFGPRVGLTPARLEKVHVWFRGYGHWTLTLCYFVPGLRHFAAVVAGTSALEWPIFARFAYTGALLWVTTFLTLGCVLGENWESALALLHRYAAPSAIVAVVAFLLVWRWRAIRRSSRKAG